MTRTTQFARFVACAQSLDLDRADADRQAGVRAKALLKIESTIDGEVVRVSADCAARRRVFHRVCRGAGTAQARGRRDDCEPGYRLRGCGPAGEDRRCGLRHGELATILRQMRIVGPPARDSDDGRAGARRAFATAVRPARGDKRILKGRRFVNDTGGVGRLGRVGISVVAATRERFDVCWGPRTRESG